MDGCGLDGAEKSTVALQAELELLESEHKSSNGFLKDRPKCPRVLEPVVDIKAKIIDKL